MEKVADYPFIPTKVFYQMEKLGVYERDVYDVWNNGEYVKLPNGLELVKKKYDGWGELYVCYTRRFNGEYVIVKVGKRPRR